MEQELVEAKKKEMIQRLEAIKKGQIEVLKQEEELLQMQRANEEKLEQMKSQVAEERKQGLIWKGLSEQYEQLHDDLKHQLAEEDDVVNSEPWEQKLQ